MPIPCSRRIKERSRRLIQQQRNWPGQDCPAEIELCVLLLYDAEVVIAALNLLREIPYPRLKLRQVEDIEDHVFDCHLYNHRVCGYNAKVLRHA